MRIAYLMSRFPKVTETFILREMIELEKLGFSVEVFPLLRENETLIQPDAKSFVARAHFTPPISMRILWANVVSVFRRPFRYFAMLYTLVRANLGSARYLAGAIIFFPKAAYFAERMNQLGISHIHAHFASHPAAVAFAVGRLTGIPFSFVAHGSDLHRDQHMLVEKTREAEFVIAISDYNREMIAGIVGPQSAGNVHVLHCGIDFQQFSPRAAPTPFARDEGPFRIVCVGTLHEVKGQTYLIEACSILKSRGLDFTCHFLGGGCDAQALREQASGHGLGAQISFHGSCTSEDVIYHLHLSDVLVVPSVQSRDGRREGIPVVLMEAMACAVPCVASRLSGIPELVEHEVSGLLTPPGDPVAIADALERLAGDASLRSAFGTHSVQKVKRHFSSADNTRELAELFLSASRDRGRVS